MSQMRFRKPSPRGYFLVALLLLLSLSLPTFFVQSLRVRVVSMARPLWRLARKGGGEKQVIAQLQAENRLLGEQISSPREIASGRVLYRDPGSWGSSLWIDLGSKDVKKNSPVVVGESLVGVVDYVGKKQSRVRLITDVALKPSVCAQRGKEKAYLAVQRLDGILRSLVLSESTRRELEEVKEKLSASARTWALARGVVQGAGSPLWRSASARLRGIGFHFEKSDEPEIAVGDLLVTTGLDGVFPAGLRVAEVSFVHASKEGSFTYEIDAIPLAGNLDDLHTVHILPPVGFEECL